MKKITYKLETVLRKAFDNWYWKIREAAWMWRNVTFHFFKKEGKIHCKNGEYFFRNAASNPFPSIGKLQRETTYKKSLTILSENMVLSKAISPIIAPNWKKYILK